MTKKVLCVMFFAEAENDNLPTANEIIASLSETLRTHAVTFNFLAVGDEWWHQQALPFMVDSAVEKLELWGAPNGKLLKAKPITYSMRVSEVKGEWLKVFDLPETWIKASDVKLHA